MFASSPGICVRLPSTSCNRLWLVTDTTTSLTTTSLAHCGRLPAQLLRRRRWLPLRLRRKDFAPRCFYLILFASSSCAGRGVHRCDYFVLVARAKNTTTTTTRFTTIASAMIAPSMAAIASTYRATMFHAVPGVATVGILSYSSISPTSGPASAPLWLATTTI